MRNVSSGSLLSIVHSIVPHYSGSRQRRKALILYAMILTADSDGPDQTARSHSLIWAFAVRACPEDTFWLGTAHLFSTTNMKTCLFKYNEIFTTKNEHFQIKNSNIFHISAKNINCGFSLEPPRRGGSNEYHNLSF